MAVYDTAYDSNARVMVARRLVRLSACMLLLGCSVQLTAPYSEEIDKESSSLQFEFFKFVANMQTNAGTEKGYFKEHVSNYNDFDARIAVIRLRSEALDGGVPCGKAADTAASIASRSIRDPALAQIVGAQGSQSGFGDASCVTILTIFAQQQMQDLRALHEAACQPAEPPRRCRSVFSAVPLFSIVGTGQGQAPVNLVSLTLNEIVRQEARLKPIPRT